MSRVGWSLNLRQPWTTCRFVRHSSILCRSSPATYARLVARRIRVRSCFLVRPSRDRRSSRAHVRTNAARARTCRGGVVSASIRRIQFLKGNHRRPLWGITRSCRVMSRGPAKGGEPTIGGSASNDPAAPTAVVAPLPSQTKVGLMALPTGATIDLPCALKLPQSFQSHRRSAAFRQRASGSCSVVGAGRP